MLFMYLYLKILFIASKDFNNNTLSKINKKIMEYIKNATKISFRYKRELYENSERGKYIYI